MFPQVHLSASSQLQTRSWLDAPLNDWNSEAAIPKAPLNTSSAQDWERCSSSIRRPSGGMEQAIAAQGWKLFEKPRVFDKLRVLQAASSMDGGCRPMGYQGFVFEGRRFMGTVAPATMDSRSDGALEAVVFPMADHITIDVRGYMLMAYFNRYKPGDPVCCPTSITVVSYVLTAQPSTRHLLAKTAVATANVSH